jgi:hypothetical protein
MAALRDAAIQVITVSELGFRVQVNTPATAPPEDAVRTAPLGR